MTRLGRLYISTHRLALVLAMLEGAYHAPGSLGRRGVGCALSEVGSLTESAFIPVCGDDLTSLEAWAPWPARKPFADEVYRWWPSRELPPVRQEAAPPGNTIRPIPELPLFPAHAGLLNVWA
ncbi:MAG TPA: hypothetical protein VLM89_08440 [Phycisphaerae bacterium]|nr:hypothetical protein [Phycisphaerae bacterium]